MNLKKKFLNDTEEEYLSGKKQLDEVLEKELVK